MENKIFLISQDDLVKSGCIDSKMAIDVVKETIDDYCNGKVLFPDKVSQIFDELTQDRINCLPATLITKKVCGVKWVSVFPSNVSRGIQNLSAVMILSSTETGFPFAFLEATVCSNLRTAAISTVAAEYLAPKEVESVGFVGAGQQARYHFAMLKYKFPEIKRCFVASRTKESEYSFISEFETRYPDVEFVSCESDYEKAVRGRDILVTAISGQSPIVKAEWIDKGMLYLHVGGWEDEYAVALKADKIVCDNWDSVKHRTQTISRLYKEGKLTDCDIYCDIDELVSEKKCGRENNNEFIYFNAVGLSFVDVALAYRMYEKCKLKEKGVLFTLRSDETPMPESEGE